MANDFDQVYFFLSGDISLGLELKVLDILYKWFPFSG